MLMNIGTIAFLVIGLMAIRFSRLNAHIPRRCVILLWTGVLILSIGITRVLFVLQIIGIEQNRDFNSFVGIGILAIMLIDLWKMNKNGKLKI